MADDITIARQVTDRDVTENLNNSVENLQFVLQRLNRNSSLGNNPDLLESIEKVLAVVNATDEYAPSDQSFLDRLSQVE